LRCKRAWEIKLIINDATRLHKLNSAREQIDDAEAYLSRGVSRINN